MAGGSGETSATASSTDQIHAGDDRTTGPRPALGDEGTVSSHRGSAEGAGLGTRLAATYDRFRRLGSTRSVVYAAVVAIGVLAAGLVLTVALALVSWALDHAPGTTSADAARLGLQGWYLAHGAELDVAWGTLSVPPLVLSLLMLYLLYRAGRQLARRDGVPTLASAAEAVAALSVTYVVAAVFLSGLAQTASVRVDPVSLMLQTGAYAALAAGLGVLVESGLGHRLLNRLPGPAHAYARGGLAGVMVLVAGSALAVVASLVLHSGQVAALTRAVTTETAGGWVIAVLAALYLPNAVVSAVAFTTGAGFSLGTGTTVSLTTISVGPLPAFPLFAALPDGEGGSLTGWLSAVVPVLAAVAAAVVFVRSLDLDERRVPTALAGVVGIAGTTALLTAGLALLAAGSLGDGRLVHVGPVAWRTGLYAGAVLGLLSGLTIAVLLARGLVTGVARRGTRFDRAERQALAAIDEEEVVAAVIDDDADDVEAEDVEADGVEADAVAADEVEARHQRGGRSAKDTAYRRAG